MNQMQNQMQEAQQLQGFFSEMINQGKLIKDSQGNIDVNNNYGAASEMSSQQQ